MQHPLHHKNQIPFFHNKSEKEIQADLYERFDPMVLRQSILQLADELWGANPLQAILHFAAPAIPSHSGAHILEVGCSVGRWIGSIAESNPMANCWGMDYSYQLLKLASDYWMEGKNVHLNLSRYGFSATHQLAGKRLENLKFGLARAEELPFKDESQDVVLNSFLFDRLADPGKGMQEMFRVLKKGGKMVWVSPLNFSKMKHWEQFYPPIKISQLLMSIGFKILDWQEDFIIEEPLDLRGNKVRWNCIAGILSKES